MKIDILAYNQMLIDNNISIIYSGPLWAEGIDGMAEFIQRRLDKDELTLNASQSIFSVFVEQVNNMLMYSVEKEQSDNPEKHCPAAAKGIFMMGKHDNTYFLQTGNYMKTSSVDLLKGRIDHLNTLDKQELRQFFKEQRKAEDNNPESKGGGIGLIEVARRATSKIDYEFIPHREGLTYFTMYVTI
jgi:hypothetical protein